MTEAALSQPPPEGQHEEAGGARPAPGDGCDAPDAFRALVTIPTYNNRETLRSVVERTRDVWPDVLVVDDGSDDGAAETLEGLDVAVVRHATNRGKGAAALTAAAWAEPRGFTHVVSLDADGQHDPRELPLLLDKARKRPQAIVIGARRFGDDAPGSSRFGSKFSNFWVKVSCGASHPDTQSGYRVYPVFVLRNVKCRARGYAFDVEILVRTVWAGGALEAVPASVSYDEAARRASHFDKFRDNARISATYTRLVTRQLIPWPHRRLIQDPEVERERLSFRRPWRSLGILLREATTPREVAAAAWVGVFLGTLPLIACHSVVILFVATRLRLNRLIALNVSHICMPPLVPALSIEAGHFLRHGRFLTELSWQTLGREALERLWEWLLGSLIVGPMLGAVVAALLYGVAVAVRRARRAGGRTADG